MTEEQYARIIKLLETIEVNTRGTLIEHEPNSIEVIKNAVEAIQAHLESDSQQ